MERPIRMDEVLCGEPHERGRSMRVSRWDDAFRERLLALPDWLRVIPFGVTVSLLFGPMVYLPKRELGASMFVGTGGG
jgi:hypothetical protein